MVVASWQSSAVKMYQVKDVDARIKDNFLVEFNDLVRDATNQLAKKGKPFQECMKDDSINGCSLSSVVLLNRNTEKVYLEETVVHDGRKEWYDNLANELVRLFFFNKVSLGSMQHVFESITYIF